MKWLSYHMRTPKAHTSLASLKSCTWPVITSVTIVMASADLLVQSFRGNPLERELEPCPEEVVVLVLVEGVRLEQALRLGVQEGQARVGTYQSKIPYFDDVLGPEHAVAWRFSTALVKTSSPVLPSAYQLRAARSM